MKRTILTGILALLAGVAVLMAQQGKPAPAGQAAPAAQAAQAAPAAPAGPHPKSAEERTALQALMAAQNSSNPDQAAKSDGIVKAAEDVLTKFPDTDYKELVLSMEAMAYQMKGGTDSSGEQVAWGRVLAVNPKSIAANLNMGGIIAKETKDKALDREEQLAKAENYLNTAISGIQAQLANPAASAAAQAELKIDDAEAHKGLALVALTRATANTSTDPKKYDKAVAEFQIAANEDPAQTTYQAQLARLLYLAGKNAESLALCDKILALPNLLPAIKTYTTNLRAEVVKAAPAAK